MVQLITNYYYYFLVINPAELSYPLKKDSQFPIFQFSIMHSLLLYLISLLVLTSIYMLCTYFYIIALSILCFRFSKYNTLSFYSYSISLLSFISTFTYLFVVLLSIMLSFSIYILLMMTLLVQFIIF